MSDSSELKKNRNISLNRSVSESPHSVEQKKVTKPQPLESAEHIEHSKTAKQQEFDDLNYAFNLAKNYEEQYIQSEKDRILAEILSKRMKAELYEEVE